MKKLILIGTGGHTKACIDVIEEEKKYKIIGLIAKNKTKNNRFMNYPILGQDKDLKKFLSDNRDIKNYVYEANKKMQNSIKKIAREIRSVRAKVSRLEKVAHEPRKFVICEDCRNKIKEK